MEVTTIIMIVMIILLFYIIVSYVMGGPSAITSLTSAKIIQTIAPASLDGSSASAAANFTYSIWFYLDDWNYNVGKYKPIFVRTNATLTASADDQNIPADIYCPKVVFQPNVNAIDIMIDCTPATGSSSNQRDTCTISNIPIQKWVNLLISVYGITEDIYLDGKLVKTHILPAPPVIGSLGNSGSVFITPNGGFSGWTNKFQYLGEPTNPQQAWNIYQSGYGGNWVANMFSQYSVKLAVMQGERETTSLTF